jgi:hypothetical protein
MFSWFWKLVTRQPRWESSPYKKHRCAGCEEVIQQSERARRCECKPASMRHDACMTGRGHSCPFCGSVGVLIIWK